MIQSGDREPARRQPALAALRWGAAAIVVAAIHFTAAWAALNWRKVEATPDAPPPAVMIDLAPLAVAPPAPPQEVAPGPQMTELSPSQRPIRRRLWTRRPICRFQRRLQRPNRQSPIRPDRTAANRGRAQA